eukprot:242514_1
MADNEPTHSYHKQLEDICCILKECTLIDSLKICDAIIAQISEYSIGSIVRCEYWEYCKNMVVVVDHEVDEYEKRIDVEYRWYPGHWVFQYICCDCAARCVVCNRDILMGHMFSTQYCDHLSLPRKCRSCNVNTIQRCAQCSKAQCSHCDCEIGRHWCDTCSSSTYTIHEESQYGCLEGLQKIEDSFVYCARGCGNLICKQCYYNGLSRCQRCFLTFCKDCIDYCDECNTFRCRSVDDSDCYYTQCRYGRHADDISNQIAFDDYVSQRNQTANKMLQKQDLNKWQRP